MYRNERNYGNGNGYSDHSNKRYGNSNKGYNTNTRPSEWSKNIKCLICKDTFPNTKALYWHKKKMHSNRTFYCSICNKPFGSMANLKEHKTTHTVYGCENCPESFQFKESLEAHLKHAHNAPTPPVLSASKTTDKSLHKQTFSSPIAASTPATSFSKSPEKPSGSSDSGISVKLERHQCPHCIKSFEESEKLKSHVKIHTEHDNESASLPLINFNDKSYSCPYCIKKFNGRRELQLHMDSSHTNVFYCKKCPAEYSTRVELDAHVKVHY